jgi:hypothetical protein
MVIILHPLTSSESADDQEAIGKAAQAASAFAGDGDKLICS